MMPPVLARQLRRVEVSEAVRGLWSVVPSHHSPDNSIRVYSCPFVVKNRATKTTNEH